MLQTFRIFAKSLVAKMLFALLLVSFAVWGIGDLFRQKLVAGSGPIQVGDEDIEEADIRANVDQQLQRLRQQGMPLDREQAKAFGVVDNQVQELVARALLDQETKRLHLAVGEDEIAKIIAADPSFQDKQGKFDRAEFQHLLAVNHLSEQQYVDLLRKEIPRGSLAGVAQNVAAPETLVRLLFDLRQERRVAEFVFLPDADAKPPAAPTEAVLKAYYAAHKPSFTAPEYRGFTLLLITADDAASSVAITDDQLREAYKERYSQFQHGELRRVKQMLLPDEASARRAESALARGQDFATVAATLAHQSGDTVDLGLVEKSALPSSLGDAAFALKPGQISQPVKTDFGWTVVRVDAVQPPGTLSFDDAKPKLLQALRKEGGSDALYQLSNKIEDALAAGADVAAIAKQFALKPIAIPSVDAGGHRPDGQSEPALTLDADAILKTVFTTPQGQTSALVQAPDDKFFVVHTDRVTPSALRPFATAEISVRDAWLAGERATANASLAQALAAEVKPGMAFATVAARHRLATTVSEPVLRADTEAALPAALTQKLFTMQPGEVTTAHGSNGASEGQYVAALKEIRHADPQANQSELAEVEKKLDAEMGTELILELDDALRLRYPVHIDRARIDQLF